MFRQKKKQNVYDRVNLRKDNAKEIVIEKVRKDPYTNCAKIVRREGD